MKIKEMNEAERPREKMFARGPEVLSDAELLAVLLRCGTHEKSALEIGGEMMTLSGSTLSGLFAMSPERLCSIVGVKKGKATAIVAALELGRRFFREKTYSIKHVDSSSSAVSILMPEMKGLRREELWVLMLNRRCALISKRRLSSGSDFSTALDIKAVVRATLDAGAANVIIAHNHPSGNPRPSASDIERTESLKLALSTFDIGLVDSLIICDSCYYSFSDEKVHMDFEHK